MAEFALGLTRKAVEGTLSRVPLAIEKEAEVQAQVKQDLVFITGEFQMMQSFLSATNAERANNQVVRTWVRQLRDLAFDVEDWVEFVVHMDDKSAWWWRMVPSWIAELVPSCIAELVLPLRPLDEAADEIKLLKARVEEVSQRYTRYNLISDSGSKPAEQPAATTGGVPAFHILREAWETERGSGLRDLITGDDASDTRVISVWSSPGAGLLGMGTSVLIKAYGDPTTCQKFKRRAWVKLMHPFDRHEFCKNLLVQFYPDEEQFHKMNSRQVDHHLQRVNKEKYLVILEEVSSVVEWDAIRKCLRDSNHGSRIVVSTRQLGVALLCAGEPHRVSDLRWSSDGQSLCAIFNKNKKNGEKKAGSEEKKIHGRKSERKSLKDRLERKMAFVSVWGIAGVGKSALVRSIYHNQEAKATQSNKEEEEATQSNKKKGKATQSNKKEEKANFAMFSWVDVPAQFNLTDLSWHLLLDFHSNDFHNKDTAAIGIMEGLDPVQECCKILRQHRCLVVIDGLRSTHDWDLIKDAFSSEINTNKSCIVVISNEKNTAEHVIRDIAQSTVLIVKGLPADVARSLFKEVDTKSIDGLIPGDMDKLTNRAITISGGLPKVIAAIGKELEKLATNTWHAHRILDNYRRIDSLRSLFSWMQSYLDASADSLKPCIFYLSVFTVHQHIWRRRLVTRWIAEGYSRDSFGSTEEDWDSSRGRSDGTTADENGEKYFSDLIALTIIQQFTTSSVCQVNGFFHGYITSQPMEDNHVFALEGRCKPNSRRTGQHLTIRSNWHRDINVFQSIDFTRLRSLTVFGKWESFLISDRMKRLRVLDLEDAYGVEDRHLEEMVKQLTRLKFLSLRGCKRVNRLPGSLGGMRQLQTLDVRHTSIVVLPPEICKLPMLQYIRAGNTEPWYEGDSMAPIQPAENDEDWITTPLQEADNRGVEVPAEIGNLTALHTLGIVNVSGAGWEALLKELKKLTQLRRLKVSGINRGNIRQFFSAISGHRHLEFLSVRLEENMEHAILEELATPPWSLRNLKLYGEHALNLELWISKFQNVKFWDVEMDITTGKDLRRPLEELVVKNKILRRLCVKLVQDGELQLDLPNSESIKFQNLKIDCRSKSKVTFAKSKLVKVLKVRCSSGSDFRFSGLQNLNALKEIWLMGNCGDTLKQELKQQLSSYKDDEKPVVKLMQSRPDYGYSSSTPQSLSPHRMAVDVFPSFLPFGRSKSPKSKGLFFIFFVL